MGLQEVSEVAQEMPLPEHTTMTVEEFLARDIDGYEYVKGELVPMSSRLQMFNGASLKRSKPIWMREPKWYGLLNLS